VKTDFIVILHYTILYEAMHVTELEVRFRFYDDGERGKIGNVGKQSNSMSRKRTILKMNKQIWKRIMLMNMMTIDRQKEGHTKL